MSLNCFFGAEVKPDGTPFTPQIPAQSSLVITQCAVTSVVPPAGSAGTQYGAVTLYVQSHDVPARMAVCTLAPAQHGTYSPLQLVFSKNVTFTLVPRPPTSSDEPTPAYPTVHLTGYYEHEEADDDDEEEEVMDFAGDEDDDDAGEARADTRAPPRRRARNERQRN